MPHGRDAWAVTLRGARLKAVGEAVVDLGVGDPDVATPPRVAAAATQALRAGRTHYAPAAGEPALRSAIAESVVERTGSHVDASQIVVFPGTQPALFATLLCTVGPGDEVITLEPVYTSYERCIAAVGARNVRVALSPDTGFDLDVAAVEAACTARTRAILLNSPNNPTGAVYGRADVTRLAELCAARGIWCIADEVYHSLIFDVEHSSPLGVAAGRACTVVVDSLSKSHAMTGWRIGWAVAPEPLAAALGELALTMLISVNQFVQDAAVVALRERRTLTAGWRDELRSRRDTFLDALAGAERLSAHTPKGAFYAFLDVTRSGLDDITFADRLLDQERVVVIPGAGFGEAGRQHVRVALTVDAATLRDAAVRLARIG